MYPILNIVKVITPAAIAFFIGIAITPLVTHYLYKYKAWKKKGGKVGLDGKPTTVRDQIHAEKDVGTPRMGGIIVWASALITIFGFFALARLLPESSFTKLDFLSRNQTWLPLFTLVAGAFVGFVDDLLEIKGSRDYRAGGMSLRKRLLIVGVISAAVGWWLYMKLEVVSIGIPFLSDLHVGALIVPIFMFVTLCIYAGGIIDGIDGLSGGVFAAMFSSYSAIAFYHNQINLAAFCAMIVGALLAFVWFNIPPARFYMTETGMMGLTLTLATIAFMTDTLGDGIGVSVLPIIAFPLVITVASVVLQIFSKRLRGKKLFRVAPLHHHFEAVGWPSYKVAMRYWVISVIFAFLGLIVALIATPLP